jgi:hypothetical protein
VRIWKKLKNLGAVSIKNTVYILPFNTELQENIQWLTQEIKEIGGEATLLYVDSIENMSEDEIIDLFQRARNVDYTKAISHCQALLDDLNKTPREKISGRLEQISNSLNTLNKRIGEIEQIDYFSSDKGIEARNVIGEARAKMEDLKARNFDKYLSHTQKWNLTELRGKTWVTRAKPHIDRVASAWLIKKFIDKEAIFKFQSEKDLLVGAIKFDIVNAELSHHGEDCTFETILKRFDIKDRTLLEIAEIVHDIDLKDEKFGRQEARGLDVLIRGLSNILEDDQRVLETGSLVFDALYSSLGGRLGISSS